MEWGVFVLLFALLWVAWRQRRGRGAEAWVVRGACLFLFLYTWSPCATFLMGLLEWQAPTRPAVNPGAQAMVVLAGGLLSIDPPEPGVMPAFSTDIRCRHAAWLYQHGWRMPVIPTGGPVPRGSSYAAVMERILLAEGVPAADIWKEDRAMSTYESAQFTAQMLQAKGIRHILLVTEAYHMPRAVRVFRRAGFTVTASPCSYRTKDFEGTWQDWLILAPKSMVMSEQALHENLAFLWLRLTGRL